MTAGDYWLERQERDALRERWSAGQVAIPVEHASTGARRTVEFEGFTRIGGRKSATVRWPGAGQYVVTLRTGELERTPWRVAPDYLGAVREAFDVWDRGRRGLLP